MSFTCEFYNYSGPPNKIIKDLGNSMGSKACSPYQAVSQLHGFIILEYNSDLEAANYVRVYQTNEQQAQINVRYYYIEDWIKNTGSQLQLRLELDPLMTFQSSILALNCFCTRTNLQAGEGSNIGYNMDMLDSKRPMVVYDRIRVIGSELNGAVKTFNATDSNVYAQCIGGDD